MRITVIGAGTWGTVVAALAARSHSTTLWARRPELAEAISSQRRNLDYLPSFDLPEGLQATSDLASALDGSELVLVAVPSHVFRTVLTQMVDLVPPDVPIATLVKGIEVGSGLRMTQIVAEIAPERDPSITGVLTGPNLAPEIARGDPTAAVAAFADESVARLVQGALMGPTFRVYTNTDVIGCEVAGAVKNVLAIAAGMARGLGLGHNTIATLITRSIVEQARLGVALGGRPETFAGLAGMGDLIATCQSSDSRNNRVGFGLACGRSLREITEEMHTVAEGIKTVGPVLQLADAANVEMPIAVQVGLAVNDGVHPRRVLANLMGRDARPE